MQSTLILLSIAAAMIVIVSLVFTYTLKKKSSSEERPAEWRDTVDSYVSERLQTTRGISLEMNIVTSAIRQDPDYAWSWYCNLKMSFMDQGCPADVAAKGAASFLRTLADVDMSTHRLYIEDVKQIEESAFAKLTS